MMRLFFLILTASLVYSYGSAQNELVSCYNSYSEVYGGTEDGGVSRTESYYFAVYATITLKEIYLDNEQLVLQKGDTLVINVSKFTPYYNYELDTNANLQVEKPKEPSVRERYKIFQSGYRYYANVQYPYQWNGTVAYSYKKESFVATAKPGFDSGYTGYAP